MFCGEKERIESSISISTTSAAMERPGMKDGSNTKPADHESATSLARLGLPPVVIWAVGVFCAVEVSAKVEGRPRRTNSARQLASRIAPLGPEAMLRLSQGSRVTAEGPVVIGRKSSTEAGARKVLATVPRS